MSNDTLSDIELIQGCLKNDRKSQEVLYYRYSNDMYSVCLMYAQNREDARDILQDSFIKVFKKIASFKGDGALRGWIRRIVVHTAINYYNKYKREEKTVVPMRKVGHVDGSINDILEGLNAKDVIKLVNLLPSRARTVLKLFYIEGYKHQEIAEIMSISEGTSKSQLSRAKSLLKYSIEKTNGGF